MSHRVPQPLGPWEECVEGFGDACADQSRTPVKPKNGVALRGARQITGRHPIGLNERFDFLDGQAL